MPLLSCGRQGTRPRQTHTLIYSCRWQTKFSEGTKGAPAECCCNGRSRCSSKTSATPSKTISSQHTTQHISSIENHVLDRQQRCAALTARRGCSLRTTLRTCAKTRRVRPGSPPPTLMAVSKQNMGASRTAGRCPAACARACKAEQWQSRCKQACKQHPAPSNVMITIDMWRSKLGCLRTAMRRCLPCSDHAKACNQICAHHR